MSNNDYLDIKNCYSGKKIFITGGTGFLGKVLVEKLLRTLPGVSLLFMLIRKKKGKCSEERMEKIFDNMVRQIYLIIFMKWNTIKPVLLWVCLFMSFIIHYYMSSEILKYKISWFSFHHCFVYFNSFVCSKGKISSQVKGKVKTNFKIRW